MCCALMCCAVLCCAVLCCVVLCSDVLCCAVLHCAVLSTLRLACALLVLCCAQVSDPTSLFLGNAGTAMRPLTAVMCAGKGDFVMDGTPRMRERPIVDLVNGLKQVGSILTSVRFCAVRVLCDSVWCGSVRFGLAWFWFGSVRFGIHV